MTGMHATGEGFVLVVEFAWCGDPGTFPDVTDPSDQSGSYWPARITCHRGSSTDCTMVELGSGMTINSVLLLDPCFVHIRTD